MVKYAERYASLHKYQEKGARKRTAPHAALSGMPSASVPLFSVRVAKNRLLKLRLASHLTPKSVEGLPISIRKHDTGMHLTPMKFRKLHQRQLCICTVCSRGREGDQNLIRMKPRILAAQILRL